MTQTLKSNFFQSLHKEEWREVRLGEVAELKYGKSYKFKNGDFLAYGSGGVVRLVDSYIYSKESILIPRKGSLNNIFYANKPFWVVDTMFYTILNITQVVPKYLYYKLKITDFEILNVGSAVPSLTINTLNEILIPLPPLPIQNQIAEILSSFDDKIDLLHRQNQTLESLALILFRHSFIENPKNPISENVNNRDKFGGETLVAQMESQNLSSAIKTAPPMWKMGKLGEEFNFIMGVSPEGSSYNENQRGIPMFQGNADFGFRFPSNRIYTTKPKRSAQAFDILISVRAPVGDVNMAKESCCIGRGLAAFKHKLDRNLYSYTFYKLKSLSQEIQQFNDKGTIFGSISKGDFENIDVPIPPLEIVKELNQQLKVFDDKIYNNSQQIQSLKQMRDLVLSKIFNEKMGV